ncbi:MAG: hypothetical protein Q8M11_22360 [Sulfuritalea sp.]|nr:hypothetical protein [Sulfuritalea sp.]
MTTETTWKCNNYGNCPKADSDEEIKLPPGAEQKCPNPDCHKDLSPRGEVGNGSAGKWQKLVIAGGAVVALAIAGVIGWQLLSAPKIPPPPVPKPPAPVEKPKEYAPKAVEAFKRGVDALASKQWPEAVAATTEALNVEPAYLEALINRSAAQIELGKLADAEKDLQQAEKIKPGNALVDVNLAAIHSLRKDNDKALAALESAIKKGFDRKDMLASDRNLENVRADPRFAELMKKLK